MFWKATKTRVPSTRPNQQSVLVALNPCIVMCLWSDWACIWWCECVCVCSVVWECICVDTVLSVCCICIQALSPLLLTDAVGEQGGAGALMWLSVYYGTLWGLRTSARLAGNSSLCAYVHSVCAHSGTMCWCGHTNHYVPVCVMKIAWLHFSQMLETAALFIPHGHRSHCLPLCWWHAPDDKCSF